MFSGQLRPAAGGRHSLGINFLARTRRHFPLLAILVLAPLPSGCGTDEIKHYRVLRLEQPQPPARTRQTGANRRLLAAIVPHGERTWFFKLMGPTEQVVQEVERFEQFVHSVQFGGNREVTWDLPSDWTERPGSESRFATIQVGTVEPPLELTVVPLGREPGTLLRNINRWRDQLALQPVTESELGQFTRQFTLGDDQVTIVDMEATGGVPAMPPGHPPVTGATGDPSRGRSGIKYTTPEGWREVPSQSAFRVASFEVTENGQRADVSVSPLSGNAGGLAANVNRWRRDQLGLPALEDAELRRTLKTIEVGGTAAYYVQLFGPESAPDGRQAIFGVIVERGAQTWFFKMTGPAELITQQQAAFEQFVRSVEFD